MAYTQIGERLTLKERNPNYDLKYLSNHPFIYCIIVFIHLLAIYHNNNHFGLPQKSVYNNDMSMYDIRTCIILLNHIP